MKSGMAKQNFWDRTEDYALECVPPARRKTWWSITFVMMAIGINISALVLGVTLANGMQLGDALAAILLGSVLLGLLAAGCAVVGSRTGLSTPMIACFAFGRNGARVVALVLAVTSLGWFGVQVGFLGSNLSSALESFGWQVSPAWLAIGGGVLMTWTAIFGYPSMERLSRWSVPLMVGLISIALLLLFAKSPALNARPVTAPMSFASAVAFVFSILVSGAATFPDLSRYARSTRDAVLGAFFGLLLGNSIMLVLAVLLAKHTGEADLIRLFAAVNMGVAALLVLTVSQWAINAANLYSASLAFPVVAPEARIPKAAYAIAAGLLGTALGASGIADHFLEFLLVLSIAITPSSGAYCAYYFVTRWGTFPAHPPSLVRITLFAWGAGVLCAWLTTPNDPASYMFGAGALTLTTIPPLDGLLVAFAIVCIPALRRRVLEPVAQ